MRVIFKHLTLIAFLLSAGPALSCGNPLLWAMLFARVPEAKAVHEADFAARRSGKLQARVYEGVNTGMTFHLWSIGWLRSAAQEMNDTATTGLAEGESVRILLADEVAVIHFESGSEPKIISAAALDFTIGFDAITTINALESGLNYGLTAEQMIEMGVLLPLDTDNVMLVAGLF